jgi:hypothetical protein
MFLRKSVPAVVACGLVAVSVSACGITAKPLAGTPQLDRASGNHAQVDDPRVKHAKCLKADGFPIREYRASGGLPAIQIGTLPVGPTVLFEPTPGIAQGVQITGNAQGAEVIGSALLYPNEESDAALDKIEGCIALGVTG